MIEFKGIRYFILSRIGDGLVIINSLIIFFIDYNYIAWVCSLLLLSIFSIIWGTMGLLGKFNEKLTGNLMLLIKLVMIFILFMFCLVNGLIDFNPFIMANSGLILLGALITYAFDVYVVSMAGV